MVPVILGNLRYEHIITSKDQMAIIYNKSLFYFKENTRYTCARDNCNCTIHVNIDDSKVVESISNEHLFGEKCKLSNKELYKRRLVNNAYDIFTLEPDRFPEQIKLLAIKKTGVNPLLKHEMDKVNKTIQGWHVRYHGGKSNSTFQDAIKWVIKMKNSKEYCTPNGEKFMHEFQNCVILTCASNLDLLVASKVFIIDGTFKKSGKGNYNKYMILLGLLHPSETRLWTYPLNHFSYRPGIFSQNTPRGTLKKCKLQESVKNIFGLKKLK